jgi:hypothetical protein
MNSKDEKKERHWGSLTLKNVKVLVRINQSTSSHIVHRSKP